jgi:hypothetical protein
MSFGSIERLVAICVILHTGVYTIVRQHKTLRDFCGTRLCAVMDRPERLQRAPSADSSPYQIIDRVDFIGFVDLLTARPDWAPLTVNN